MSSQNDLETYPRRVRKVTWAEFLTEVAGGLWLANLAVLWRTTTSSAAMLTVESGNPQ